VAERALDLALGLRSIGPAGFWIKAVMTREVDQGAIVDDAVVIALAEHRGLHAVVEDLPRRTAQRLEGCRVAAQHRREILVHDEAGPDQSAVAEDHGEQPDDPRHI